MSTILQLGLSNAAVAAILFPLVLLITARSRRPAWIHTLWVVVLLKLVTPPLIWLPVPLEFEVALSPEAPLSSPTAAAMKTLELLPVSAVTEAPIESSHVVTDVSVDSPSIAAKAVLPEATSNIAAAPQRLRSHGWQIHHWTTWLTLVWALGTVIFLLRTAIGVLKHRSWLLQAAPATERVIHLVKDVSDRIGLRRPPTVHVVPQVVTPMVYAFGRRAKVIFPGPLLKEVDDRQLSTLLTHELAHLRRGDQWVRLLEFVVSAIFWWHPIVPLVKRRIHEAEEQACDAWVMATMPGDTKCYASAMLKTIEFLSEARPQTFALATGMGDVPFLMRRMQQISSATTPHLSTHSGRITVFVLAALLLPLGMFAAMQSTVDDLAMQKTAEHPLLGLIRLHDGKVETWGPDGSKVKIPMPEPTMLHDSETETIAVFRNVPAGNLEGQLNRAGRIFEGFEAWRFKTDNSVAFARMHHPPGYRFGILMLRVDDWKTIQARNVPMQPGARPSAGDLPAPGAGSPERLTLENGVTIDVFGVGRLEGDKIRWWSPDGRTEIHVPGVEQSDISDYGTFVAMKVQNSHGWSNYQEVDGQKADVRSSFSRGAYVWTAEVDATNQRRIGTLILKIAGGEGVIIQRVVIGPDGTAAIPEEAVPGGLKEVTSIKPLSSHACQVFCRYHHRASHVEYEGIDSSGGVIQSNGASYGGTGSSLTFPCPAENLKTIIARQRQICIARFEGFSLQPGKVTNFRATQIQNEVAVSRTEVAPYVSHEILVTGTVTDAATGNPIDEFKLIPGALWRREFHPEGYRSKTFAQSSYEFAIIPPGYVPPVKLIQQLRIESRGYAAQVVSLDGSGDTTVVDFRLKRGDGIDGVILDESGEALKNAQVVSLDRAEIQNNKVSSYAIKYVTDGHGRFLVPRTDPAAMLFAFHDQGYALIDLSDLKASRVVVAKPWSKLSGVFRIGGKPVAGERIQVDFGSPARDQSPRQRVKYQVFTDAEGRYEFPQLPGWPATMQRQVVLWENDRTSRVTSSPQRGLFLEAGKAAALDLGGSGQKVTGRLIAPQGYSQAVDFSRACGFLSLPGSRQVPWPKYLTPEEHGPWYEKWIQEPEGRAFWLGKYINGFRIKEDGTFQLQDVPPGEYQLQCTIADPEREGLPYEDRHPATYTGSITVEAATARSTLNLGDLEFVVTESGGE